MNSERTYTIWEPIKGFENYEVSNHGKVFNKKTKTTLKPDRSNRVILSQDGRKLNVRVDKLVVDAFFIINKDYYDDFEIVHIDGDKLNNKIDNLRLEPIVEDKILCIETGQIFDSITECSEIMSVPYTAIWKCINGRQKSYKNLNFIRIY